jgi:hypothetical protein
MLTILGLVVTGGFAINSFVWAQHAETMRQFEKRMVGQFSNVEKRLDRIDRTLERKDR